ncbi:MAG: TolC family protein [Chitinophagaceae bacterium]|nr:TolC family protein [Chitinophagaceae bacterium]
MRRNFLKWILCFVLLPGSLCAQDTVFANLPSQWRLEDCISYASLNNITLTSLRLSTRSAEEDYMQSKAAVNPDLYASASQSFMNSRSLDVNTGNYKNRFNVSGNYGANSSIVLYHGGFLRYDIQSKDLFIQAAKLDVEETTNSLTLSITQAFFNILLAREVMVSFEALLSTSEGQLTQGQQRYDAGSIANKELLQLQSQVAGDRYNLIRATNNFRLNTVILKQLLFLPTSIDFAVTVPGNFPVPTTVYPLPDAQQEALQSRPEIKNREVLVRIAQTDMQKMRAMFKPTISMQAGLGTGYSDAQSAKFLSQLGNNVYQSLSISLSVPIYTRRVNKTNINKSDIRLQQSRLLLYEAKAILNQQVEQTYINLQNAVAEYDAAQKQLTFSEQIYFITNEQMKLGAVTTLELLQQKNIYVQALQVYTQAKYSLLLYEKIYEFYRGIPVRF